ncbi:MAG: ISAzo13 family transposase [Rhodospirillales bacterium]|nr:ISAzo13 family transposase [Rhodospirillales bacterium]HIJ42459.1 ISAzo13 family transposase [Rhodospirillaceae bacterium]MDP7216197.1 ISAzo13 family transposase [Rhodospirillales bacterium]HIJ45050.1 ISAzo13 family transposase [Rhodospirillaceae bacterium]HIJ91993.1 ISAzo13 family transposase [Rhodospirillaceae bacterium]
MQDTEGIRYRYEALYPHLDEKARRLFAAAEARTVGWGEIKLVCEITGIARSTIGRGLDELDGKTESLGEGRVRRRGGGRKLETEKQPSLLGALESLVAPATRGDPERPLPWVSKSYRHLANGLRELGFSVSHQLVGRLLDRLGYTLQANVKRREGTHHPDRDGQFEHINGRVTDFLAAGQPVISVDTKKKELVGDFKNGGREWRPQGKPEEVNVHDFADKKLGKVAPYGGSNGARVRLWKVELQKLASELGLEIMVCYLPPGTSKWNRIEHRLFSFISQNWRGKPLRTLATIVNLIGATTTNTGLKVYCDVDHNAYPKGVAVSDDEMTALNIRRAEFHGQWNYSFLPA